MYLNKRLQVPVSGLELLVLRMKVLHRQLVSQLIVLGQLDPRDRMRGAWLAIQLDFLDRLKLGDVALSLLLLSAPLAPPAWS